MNQGNNRSSNDISRRGSILLPLKTLSGRTVRTTLHLFQGNESYHVLQFGDLKQLERLTVRIESACTYAHLYGSRLCDCEWQLKQAIELLSSEGGILVYALDQHGRGIGLLNHLYVYEQEQKLNLDTVEAHRSLGLDVDARSYEEISAVIEYFGYRRICLMTNNPSRIQYFERAGFDVTHKAHESPIDRYNTRELMIKKEKLNHALSFTSDIEWIRRMQEWLNSAPLSSRDLWGVQVVLDHERLLFRNAMGVDDTKEYFEQLANHTIPEDCILTIFLQLVSRSNEIETTSFPDLSVLECLFHRIRLVVDESVNDLFSTNVAELSRHLQELRVV